MMTRKDYVAVANIINGFLDLANVDLADVEDYLIFPFAQYFQDDNPNFDRARFFDACLKEEK